MFVIFLDVEVRHLIYLGYLLTAAAVVILSIKASQYIDLLDKHTRLSGAFLGGVMLSAVTSFPELFTSISAVLLFERPAFSMGNILGSDLFNLMVFSIIVLFNGKRFVKGRISKSYRDVTVLVLLLYIFIGAELLDVINVRILDLSLTSFLILLIYIFGAKYLSVAADVNADEEALGYHAGMTTKLSIKQIGTRFALSALGIIVFSCLFTYFTEQIAEELDLTQGMAGALLLGIATSLPEASFTLTLFRMKNFNIAVGNIIGSNLFNMVVLPITDLLSPEYIYVADEKILQMLLFGCIATPLFYFLLKYNGRRKVVGICAAGIAVCYAVFLIL